MAEERKHEKYEVLDELRVTKALMEEEVRKETEEKLARRREHEARIKEEVEDFMKKHPHAEYISMLMRKVDEARKNQGKKKETSAKKETHHIHHIDPNNMH